MRNYDLVSSARDAAQENRLVSPKWYQTDIDRKILKQLLLRDDAPAMRDIIIFYGLMVGLGLCAVMMMPSWLSLPFWLAYGVSALTIITLFVTARRNHINTLSSLSNKYSRIK